MNTNVKLGALVAAASTLAIAVPAAAAHPGNSDHGARGDHSSHSHKCQTHNVAYVESGTVDSATPSTLAANPDGTWSGTLVVDVARTNHRAKADKNSTVTYTFANAKLRVVFDGGATGFAAGERVQLIGKLAAVAKKCTTATPAPAPAFRMVVVHPAATQA
jgi:hypothetical protein